MYNFTETEENFIQLFILFIKIRICCIYSEGSHSRAESGLHSCWLKVKKWLTFSGPVKEKPKFLLFYGFIMTFIFEE